MKLAGMKNRQWRIQGGGPNDKHSQICHPGRYVYN
jgi:hypothetical protein